jgi:hypothetical protein
MNGKIIFCGGKQKQKYIFNSNVIKYDIEVFLIMKTIFKIHFK